MLENAPLVLFPFSGSTLLALRCFKCNTIHLTGGPNTHNVNTMTNEMRDCYHIVGL